MRIIRQCKYKKIRQAWSDPKKLDGLNIIRFEKEFGIVPGSFLLSGI